MNISSGVVSQAFAPCNSFNTYHQDTPATIIILITSSVDTSTTTIDRPSLRIFHFSDGGTTARPHYVS